MIKSSTHKILVIKHGALGDITFSLDAMYSIRLHFKDSKIFLLTEKKFKNLLEKSKYFDEIISDDRAGLINSLKILNKLIIKRFDLVIDLQNSKRTNIYNFFLRYISKSIINSNRSNANFKYNIKPKGTESPKTGLNKQINLLGIKTEVDEYKWLNVNTRINDYKNLILVIPSTSKSGKYRQWPIKNFIDLCIKLEHYGKRICLIGTKNDKNIINDIIKNCKNALDFTDKSPPEIIFSIAQNCELIITNVTGPGHVAELSRNKIVWLAINDQYTKINIQNNKSNIKIVSDRIDNITVEEVFNKIKEIL